MSQREDVQLRGGAGQELVGADVQRRAPHGAQRVLRVLSEHADAERGGAGPGQDHAGVRQEGYDDLGEAGPGATGRPAALGHGRDGLVADGCSSWVGGGQVVIHRIRCRRRPARCTCAAHLRRRATRPAGDPARGGAVGAGRRPRGGDARDDRAPRDRAADGPPLRCGARRRAARRRRRAGPLRRPLPGQAAGDAAHALRVPARPPARGLGSAQRAGRRAGAAQDRQGRRGRGHRRRRRGVAATASAGDCARCSPPCPTACPPRRSGSRWPTSTARSRRLRAPSGAARCPSRRGCSPGWARAGDIVRGRNAGHWRISRPAWTTDGGVARRAGGRRCRRPRATPSWSAAGCGRSAPAPRPTSSGGSGRPRAPYAGR